MKTYRFYWFINYIQSINVEENNRYLFFDERKLPEEYEKIQGKKPFDSRITDKLDIYDVKCSIIYNNLIRLIDTKGFEDTRDESSDEIIIDDIKNLFEGSKIDNLHSICIIFKESETRSHSRTKSNLNKSFSLFGKV